MLIPHTMAITRKYLSVLKSSCMNWNYSFLSLANTAVAVVASSCLEVLSAADGKHKSPWAGSVPGCVLTGGTVGEDGFCQ